MNECITIGEQIIEVLKKFLSKPDRKLYSNKYVIEMDGVVLEELMTRQIENLRNLGDSLVDFSEIIKVVDAALYTRLEQFIAEKGVGLDWIASLLERNQITFDGLRIDDVEELSKLSDYFFQWYHHAGEISRRIEVNSLSVAEFVH
jgi:hypothetical protein